MRYRASEGLPDRELEAFGLITPAGVGVAMHRVQRDTEAEPEKTQRRQPLHRDADRALHIAPGGQPVALGGDLVRGEELQLAAGLIDTAHVEEGADPRAAAPLRGHREDELVLAGEAHIAAIGIAELVLGTQPSLAEAAHAVRAAAEELPVRRDGRGIAQRLA